MTDAVKLLYERVVDGEESTKETSKKRNRAGRLGDFVRALKTSLDKAYKPNWHVMAGNSLGFACKNRGRTVGVWHIFTDEDDKDKGERLMVVIWKSPLLEPQSEGDDASAASSAGEAAEGSTGEHSLHLIQPLAADVQEGSQVDRTIGIVRDIISRSASADNVEIAKRLRRRLTAELGTIWHVAVGREFVIEPATDCRNFVMGCFRKDVHVVCFQHEQAAEQKLDLRKILTSLPYLLVVFICFGYMAFTNICGQGSFTSPSTGSNFLVRFVENRVCTKQDWEWELGIAAIASVSTSVFAKKFLKD